ncbi:MAG: hypothetical protein IPP47_18520 [Bryobacterales bacterium]|nr:hypothetical protein [Bryobacterales bacterium]
MPALLKFCELLALSIWTGGLVHDRWLAPSGAAFRRVALICCAALALVQAARGLLWTWAGMTTPALALFAAMLLLCAWRGGLTRSFGVLAVLLGYTGWIAVRGW